MEVVAEIRNDVRTFRSRVADPPVEPLPRLLFLDFDGVLNSAPYLDARGAELARIARTHPDERAATFGAYCELVDPAAVAHLDEVVKSAGASVVVSSAWRRAWDLHDLSRVLRMRGSRHAWARLVGATGMEEAPGADSRGRRIAAYLAANLCWSYAVVDDDPAALECGDASRVVLTYTSRGLQTYHVPALVEILRRPI